MASKTFFQIAKYSLFKRIKDFSISIYNGGMVVSSLEPSEEEEEDLLLPHLPPFLPFLPPFLPFLGPADGARVVPSSELDSSSSELELHSTDPDSSDSEPLDSLEPLSPPFLDPSHGSW